MITGPTTEAKRDPTYQKQYDSIQTTNSTSSKKNNTSSSSSSSSSSGSSYTIGSSAGQSIAQNLIKNPGSSTTVSDGSTWTSDASGNVWVTKDGVTTKATISGTSSSSSSSAGSGSSSASGISLAAQGEQKTLVEQATSGDKKYGLSFQSSANQKIDSAYEAYSKRKQELIDQATSNDVKVNVKEDKAQQAAARQFAQDVSSYLPQTADGKTVYPTFATMGLSDSLRYKIDATISKKQAEELQKKIDALEEEQADAHGQDVVFSKDGTANTRGTSEIQKEIEDLQAKKTALEQSSVLLRARAAISGLDSKTKELLAQANRGNGQTGGTVPQWKLKKDAKKELKALGYSDEQIKKLAEYEQRLKDYEDYEERMRTLESYEGGVWNGVRATAASVAMAPLKALGTIEGIRGVLPAALGGYQNEDMPTNIYSPLFGATQGSAALRSGVMQDIGKTWRFLYQVGTSILDSAMNSAVSSGLVGATGLAGEAAKNAIANTMNFVVGSEVASDSVYQGIQEGKSNAVALIDGIVEGAVEGFTEKYSVGEILKSMLSGDTIWKQLRNAAASEGAEEWASNWLNRAYDVISKQDRSEVMEAYNAYRDEGKSPVQAMGALVGDFAKEDATSFLAGGLSGMAMSATFTGMNALGGRYLDPTATSLDQAMLDTMRGIQTPENVTQTRQATAMDNAILQTLNQNKNTSAKVSQNNTSAAEMPGNVLNNDTLTAMAANEGTVQEQRAPVSPTAPVYAQNQRTQNIRNYADTTGLTEDSAAPRRAPGAARSGFDPLSHASNQYGAIPAGENPTRVVDFPVSMDGETRVGRFSRTMAEASVTTQEAYEAIERLVEKNRMSHEIATDDDALTKAAQTITTRMINGQSIESIRSQYISEAAQGKVSKDLAAQGFMLFEQAVQAKDASAVVDLSVAMNRVATAAGQALQAQRMLKKLTPEWRLQAIQRSVSGINESLREQAAKKHNVEFEDIRLDNALIEEYLNAETEEARNAAVTKMQEQVAQSIPSTLAERWNDLRYINMLGNFKTQGRNILGNVGAQAMRETKNAVGVALEGIAHKVSGGKFERTKALTFSEDLWDASLKTFDQYADMAMGEAKYSARANTQGNDFMKGVQEAREKQIWTNTNSNFMNDTKAGRLAGKGMQAYRNAIDFAMNDFGDKPFSKFAFSRSLASWLKARDITAAQWSSETWREKNANTVDRAVQYAIKEAQESTFRGNNWFSDWATKVGRRNDTPWAVRLASEGMQPFRKTPANVLVQMERFSPLGLLNTAIAASKVKSGEVSGADVINSLAETLTGSALMGLGYALARAGVLRGSGDDEQDELEGHQPYALELAKKAFSYTLDWFAPTSVPLLMGANIYELAEKENIELNDIMDALLDIADPLISTSMMDGINSTLEKLSYDDPNLGQLAVELALSYLTQGMTSTLLGQFERASEKYRQQTYIDPDSPVPTWLQSTIGKASQKIPGWDYQQIDYVDNWGRKEDNGSVGKRVFDNFLSPGYSSTINTTDVDEEIRRLEKLTGKDYTPSAVPKYIEIKNAEGEAEKVYLNGDEYNVYRTTKGQADFALRQAFLHSEFWDELSPEVQGQIQDYCEAYANELGKKATLDSYQISDTYKGYENMSQEEVMNDFIVRAIREQKYLPEESQSTINAIEEKYDNAKDYHELPDNVKQAAKKELETYYANVEAAKYGENLADEYEKLSGLSEEELANHFISKAIGSEKYLPDEAKKQLDTVKNVLDGGMYTSVSSDLIDSAKEKAAEYFKEAEQAKYGGELSEEKQALEGKNQKTLAEYFLEQAANAKFKDTNDDGTRMDEVLDAYKGGEISEKLAMSMLDNQVVDAYADFGKEAGVTAEMVLQTANAYARMKTEKDIDDVVTLSVEAQLDDWLDEQNWTDKQKQALRLGYYTSRVDSYNKLVEKLENGSITVGEAKKSLTSKYQSAWTHEVSKTGTEMQDYIRAISTFEDAPSEAERDAMGFDSKWAWYCNELNKTDLSAEQKFAIVNATNDYAEKTQKKIAQALKASYVETGTGGAGSSGGSYASGGSSGGYGGWSTKSDEPSQIEKAYERFGKNVGVTESMMQQAKDAKEKMYAIEDMDGNTVKSVEVQFDAWLANQNWTAEQKEAVKSGFYTDTVKNMQWLSANLRSGNISVAEAKFELSPTIQTGWSQNVLETGADMADYIDACITFKQAPTEAERKKLGFKSKWSWFCDQLNQTDMTAKQKYAIAISMSKTYADSTKKKIAKAVGWTGKEEDAATQKTSTTSSTGDPFWDELARRLGHSLTQGTATEEATATTAATSSATAQAGNEFWEELERRLGRPLEQQSESAQETTYQIRTDTGYKEYLNLLTGRSSEYKATDGSVWTKGEDGEVYATTKSGKVMKAEAVFDKADASDGADKAERAQEDGYTVNSAAGKLAYQMLENGVLTEWPATDGWTWKRTDDGIIAVKGKMRLPVLLAG